jgi:hypothetical protein
MSPPSSGSKKQFQQEPTSKQVASNMLALSNGPNRMAVSHPLTWGRKQIQLPKRCVLSCSLEYRRMDKVQKPNNPEHPVDVWKFWTLNCSAKPRARFLIIWPEIQALNALDLWSQSRVALLALLLLIFHTFLQSLSVSCSIRSRNSTFRFVMSSSRVLLFPKAFLLLWLRINCNACTLSWELSSFRFLASWLLLKLFFEQLLHCYFLQYAVHCQLNSDYRWNAFFLPPHSRSQDGIGVSWVDDNHCHRIGTKSLSTILSEVKCCNK